MKLALIDGNAVMHRAYHALPPLTNTDGKLTNAVYGFISMLLTITRKLDPTHMIVCFDRPEPTFRKSMYAGYQAHRPKMDADLSEQFAMVKQAVDAMGIPIYEKAGYEADDVIGTLAAQAQQKCEMQNVRCEIIIVTGDRDMLQLIDETVRVYMPVQGLNNGMLFTVKEVERKYGITPAQMVDYKALSGDPSDNYPGVKGIGPKTARYLLQKFGTIENLYDAIHHQDEKARELKDKTVQALSEYAEDAGMAKKLARIVHDAPVTLELPHAELGSFNTPRVLDMLEHFGFSSLARRVVGVADGAKYHKPAAPDASMKHMDDTNEQLSLV